VGEEIKELLEFNPPEWNINDLLNAAESGLSWLFLLTIENDELQLSRFSPGAQRFLEQDLDDYWHFETWKKFLEEQEFQRVKEFFLSLPDSNRSYETEVNLKTSKTFTSIMRVTALKSKEQIIGSFQDITNEKLAEEGLQRQYQLMMSIFTTAPIPIFLCDEKFFVVETNSSGADFLETSSPAKAFGFNLLEKFDKQDQQRLTTSIKNTEVTNLEIKLKLKSQNKNFRAFAYLNISSIPYKNNQRAFIVVITNLELISATEENDRRIIVVEPHLQSRLLFEKLLSKINLKADFFLTAEKLLESYNPEKPSVVVIEEELSGMGAVDLAKKLQALHQEKSTSIKLLMLKNASQTLDLPQDLFDDVIEKPVTLAAIRKFFQPINKKVGAPRQVSHP